MRSWSKTLLVGALLSASYLTAKPASAEEKARLVYSRSLGTSCPAEVELRLSIVARLGYDPFSPQASRVVLARVEHRGHRLVGVVELVDREGSASGRRELYAAAGHCAELARALALSISLTIDAQRALAKQAGEAPDDGRAAAEPSPFSAVEAETAAEPAPGQPPPSAPRLFSGVMLAGAQGSLPGFGIGGGAYVGMGWRLLSLRLEARFLRSFHRTLPDGVTLDGNAIDPGIAGCRSFDRIQACMVGQLGILRVRSHGDINPRIVAKTHAMLGPRFVLSFPGHALSFLLGIEALLNVSLNDVRMHKREVWRAPLVSGTMLVGVETDFL